MALEKHALLTAEDYRALPEDGSRYELIQGELRMAPAPNINHQRVSGNLFYLLRQHLEQAGGGELFHGPVDVYLSDQDVVQPDLVYVADDHRAIVVAEGLRGAPTLVVEILSPSTERLDRATKNNLYRVAGVEEMWIVDPNARRVEIYRLQEDPQRPVHLAAQGGCLRSVCLPGLELDLNAVFK